MTAVPSAASSARVRWTVVAVAAALSLVASSVVVWRASYAAFSSTTENPGNTWASGSVFLTDDDGNTGTSADALFAVTGLAGGETGSRCITVTYLGTLDANVRLYTSAASGDLRPYLTMTVTRKPKTNVPANCTNYVDAGAISVYSGLLSAYPASYGTASDTWHPDETATPDEAWTYKFTYAMATDSGAQGKSTAVTFRWESLAT